MPSICAIPPQAAASFVNPPSSPPPQTPSPLSSTLSVDDMDFDKAKLVVLNRVMAIAPHIASRMIDFLVFLGCDEPEMIRLAHAPDCDIRNLVEKVEDVFHVPPPPPVAIEHQLPPHYRVVPIVQEVVLQMLPSQAMAYVPDFATRSRFYNPRRGAYSMQDHAWYCDYLHEHDKYHSCEGHECCNNSYQQSGVRERSAPAPAPVQVQSETVRASRQIYLTFPPDSSFTVEELIAHFGQYGPVQSVRIPKQDMRMYGFVAFESERTVERILAGAREHYVGGARILVKPYRTRRVPSSELF